MLSASRARNTALLLVAIATTCLTACKSGAAEAANAGSTSDISGPPTMNAAYGTRNARVCAKVTTRPDVATAIALVQCAREGIFSNSLWLTSEIQLEIGAPRAVTTTDTDINDLDASAKIYPLRGQGINWSCGLVSTYGAGTNCQKWPAVPGQIGRCWHTNFGDWKCNMNVGGQQWVVKQPGPTTY
jgi:hypothetical protein